FIDGINDFLPEHTFSTTSDGYTVYVSWDLDFFFVGMSGPDVAADSATKWVLAYLSGSPGTSTGVLYNTQQPGLGFSAATHVRWRTDNGHTGAMDWSGSDWEDALWDFSGDVFQNGTFVEMRFPRADIGDPSILRLVLAMINEQGDYEGTYAGCPDDTFTDGYDRDFATWLQFAFGACETPVEQN
ncbi:MAG TPA: hypothetical protein VM285_04890, partial [Polyangia bacterium]|nr:hypothetical protein [Polyangia bacterium]